MNAVIVSIEALTAPAVFHAIAERAVGFWIGEVAIVAVVVWAWTRARKPRVWR